MHYELSYPGGDVIDVFHDRGEALARAAQILGVVNPVEGAPSIERPGYVIIPLYMTKAQRTADEGGLLLHSFDECEECDMFETNGGLRDSDKRVIKAFVAERPADSRLLETDGVRLEKLGLGGETVAVWHQGRIAILSTESVKSDESIIRAIVKEAGPGVVDFSYARKGHRVHQLGATGGVSRHQPNGRGIYHGTGVAKNDFVLLTGANDRWRIELVTSSSGNHLDVTGPNKGYATQALATQAAQQEAHRRGIKNSEFWIVAGDGGVYKLRPEQVSLVASQRRNGNPGDPAPKFRIGERVVRDDGSMAGMVSFIGDYDPYIGGYRYKVQQDDGGRIYWNESSTRHEQHRANGPRTGILSDGTRVNVYELPDNDGWGVELFYPDGGHQTLAFDDDLKFQFEDLQAGELGRQVAWAAVPSHVKSHLELQAKDAAMVANGRNKKHVGVLSDGTRVNVYHQEGVGDPWTVVPHSEDWDSMARGDMRSMLGLSESAAGISEWSEGQEGRHLGRKVAWAEVPDHIKRHIERRVVKEAGMAANPRKRAAKKPAAETREQRIAREWAKAEEAGLVRLESEAEQESYFDVYGEPDDAEEREDIIRRAEWPGFWTVFSQFQTDSGWETADSIGFIEGNDVNDENPYVLDLKESALRNIYGMAPNARGSVANDQNVRELSLYIENEYSLVGAPNSRGKAIHENLLRKVKSGKYDPALASKAWQHLIDEGARKYSKEFGTGDVIFSPADRRQVAEEYARAWEVENLQNSR